MDKVTTLPFAVLEQLSKVETIRQEQSTPANTMKWVSGSKCPCQKAIICHYKQPVSLPNNLKNKEFTNFVQNDKNSVAFQRARDFIKDTRSLYLHGDPGCGKTHLLISALKYAMTLYCSYDYYFANVARMLKIDRLGYETREEAEERLLDKLGRKKLIFLDDFSAENVSGRTAEILYMLLNDAIENGNTRFFITGNKPIKYISENVSDRIASRLVELCGKENIIKIEDKDWRVK